MGPEHLTLGIVCLPDCGAAKIVIALAVPLDKLRQAIETNSVVLPAQANQDLNLTPEAKRVIDLAYEEARSRHHDFIDTRHLLGGVLRSELHVARESLEEVGITYRRVDAIFNDFDDFSSGDRATTEPVETKSEWVRFDENARKAIFHSVLAAQESKSTTVEPEHLLLGVLREPVPQITEILSRFGTSPAALTARIWSSLASAPASTDADHRLSPNSKLVVDEALAQAAQLESRVVGPEHLLIALVRVQSATLPTIFGAHEITFEKVFEEVKNL